MGATGGGDHRNDRQENEYTIQRPYRASMTRGIASASATAQSGG
jgi:hypothetical protein